MPEHQQIQYAFAAHLRNPQSVPSPEGIEERRMAIYRRLFFNNIFSFLTQAFPVLSSLLAEDEWQAVVRRFYAEHKSHRPQFYHLAEEFVGFLQDGGDAGLPAFSQELAHYEWLELELSVADAEWPAFESVEQLRLHSVVVLTPHLHLLAYEWPVHQIAQDYQPDQAPPQATCLMVYRGQDENVHFKQLNPMTLRMLQLLQETALPLGAVLQRLAKEAAMPVEDLTAPALQTLQALLADGAILGQQQADQAEAPAP